MDVSCHRLFFPVLLLNQQWSLPLRLQASHCSTFRIMCDVPSIAVFCSESVECFPGAAAKFFLKLLVTIPVAPIITGIIVHFRFHIRYISIRKLSYFNFFSASFCTTFLSAGIATSISVHVFSLLFLTIISGLFAVTSLSVCTAWFHNTVTPPSSHTGLGMCVYHLSYCYYYYYYSIKFRRLKDKHWWSFGVITVCTCRMYRRSFVHSLQIRRLFAFEEWDLLGHEPVTLGVWLRTIPEIKQCHYLQGSRIPKIMWHSQNTTIKMGRFPIYLFL